MIIDNTEKIRKYLDFSEPGTYYHYVIMQRGKDSVPEDLVLGNGCGYIFNGYVRNLEDWKHLLSIAKPLCDNLNARLYVSVRPRVFSKYRNLVLEELSAGRGSSIAYPFTLAGSIRVFSDNRLLNLIDADTETILSRLLTWLREKDIDYVDVIDTVNGHSIITSPIHSLLLSDDNIVFRDSHFAFKDNLDDYFSIIHECNAMTYANVKPLYMKK